MAHKLSKAEYDKELHDLQVQLVKLQRDVIEHEKKILVLFEGRDAAGKDGTILRFLRHINPRYARSVALPKPSDRQQSEWYFQRYVPHLPAGGEIVLFNRSWYNRAGVEKVMGFCTPEQYEEFMEEVPRFEQMLVRSGIKLFKFYLDISKEEQKKRLDARRDSPLKRWKLSDLDDVAQKDWDAYTEARDLMFARTHTAVAPWTVVRADVKKTARLATMRYLLTHLQYEGKDESKLVYDPELVFEYQDADRRAGLLST